MYPDAFEYHSAGDVEEAIDLLVRYGDSDVELMAGGHSLLPTMKSGLSKPDVVVDVADIDRLHGIDHGDGASHVGAMTTYATVVEDEALARETIIPETAAEIGDRQVRNMGTVGGNVAHSDPAADLPAAVLASDATIHARGPDGARTIPATEFFEAMFTTALDEDELLTGIDVPHLGNHGASAYSKKASPSSGYALVGVAVVLETDGETTADARVAANGAFDHARRLNAVEEQLTGVSVDADVAGEAAAHATDGVESHELMDDETASSEFRGHLLEVYTERAVETALDRVD